MKKLIKEIGIKSKKAFEVKLETKLIKRAQHLRRQLLVSRVQYSNINIQVDYDEKEGQIFINLYAVMDKNRYKKKIINKN